MESINSINTISSMNIINCIKYKNLDINKLKINDFDVKYENERIQEETETETETVPSGVSAETSVNITDNIPGGDNCPNSGPETSASELMESMINQIPIEKPSKSWADKSEEDVSLV